jgi:parallel beta-helix repeat protein
MKKLFCLAFLLLTVTFKFTTIHAACLSGTYTIGGASPDYVSFSAAIADLKSKGVCGKVVFNVRDGNYKEQIRIPAINGASSSNTITFQSQSADSSKVKLYYPSSNTYGSKDYTVYLAGAKYITFNQLTLSRTGTGGIGIVVLLDSSANNNSFTGDRIIGVKGALSNQNLITNAYGPTDSNITITGNVLKYGYISINIVSSYSALTPGVSISGNIIDSSAQYGIFMNEASAPNITNNRITNVGYGYWTSNPSSSIALQYVENQFQVTSNIIFQKYYGQGISVVSCNTNKGTSSNRGLIANNMVTMGVDSGQNGSRGLDVTQVKYTDFYYNSILNLNTDQSDEAASFYTLLWGDVQNNIFTTNGGIAIDIYSSSLANFDYNDIYTSGALKIGYANKYYTSFSAYQSASSQDANSIFTEPYFISNNNLRSYDIDLDSKGNANTIVTTDVDGNTRNSSTPDIGAFEFTPNALDAQIVSVDSPTAGTCGYTHDVFITLKNNGTSTLTSAKITLKVNGKSTNTSWSGSLTSGSSTVIDLDSNFFVPGKSYSVIAYVSNPNGGVDANTLNDSAFMHYESALSGTYIIGSAPSDYTSFSAAATDLNNRGICGPVVFNIKNGTYSDQIALARIKGASSTNTITFQSQSGDSSKVKLNYPSSSKTANPDYLVLLDGTSYIKFSKMSFFRFNTSIHGAVINITSCAHDVTFTNNRISKGYTSYSFADVAVNAFMSYDSNITINNNYISGGMYNIRLYAASIYNMDANNVITNNTFDSSTHAGIFVVDQKGLRISGNSIKGVANANSNEGGIAVFTCKSASITKNKINLGNYGGNGIYVISSIPFNAGENSIIANNFITLTLAGLGNTCGIYSADTSYAVYYNNIDITGSDTNSAAFSGSSRTMNNNFVNKAKGYALRWVNKKSDYNNFYSNGAHLNDVNGAVYSTLSSYQTASGQDKHSKSVDPGYTSTTNLDISNSKIIKAATPIGGITDDIHGTLRSSLAPTIGADEVSKNNAGIKKIIQPSATICAGASNVTAKLKNFGTNTITSATVSWSVNGIAQTSFSWSSTLTSQKDTLLNLGSYTFASGTSKIKVWTASPNGTTDGDSTNDTMQVSVIVNPSPAANAGTSSSICYGKSSSIGVSAVSGNTYAWTSRPIGFTDTTSNAMVNPISTTTYYLTETITSTGCNKSDSVAITIVPLPTVSAGADQSICIGTSATIGGSPISGHLHSWKSSPTGLADTTTNPTISPIVNTIYYLTDSSVSTGCKNTDTVLITIKQLPIAIAQSKWLKVDAGYVGTVGIRNDGTLWQWGNGSSVVSQVGTSTGWIDASSGESHILAVKGNGTLWAWGSNSDGELGDSTQVGKSTPKQIGKVKTWEKVSAGTLISFGIRTDGSLWGWGLNGGNLGDSNTSTIYQIYPIRIGRDNDWKTVESSSDFTFAIKNNGTLWAWGQNYQTQLGDDGNHSSVSYPIQIGTDSNWVNVSCGGYSGYAIKTDSTIWGWGNNTYGELGDSTTTTKQHPTQIGKGKNWVSISGGFSHAIGIKSDATLWTWGGDSYGQLGDGATSNRSVPTKVGSDKDWSFISGGREYSEVVKKDGSLWACGHNQYYQLGEDNTSTNRATLYQVGTAGGIRKVCAGTAVQIGASSFSGYSYSWNSNPGGLSSTSSSPIVKPNGITTYTITATAAGCSAKDSVTIIANTVANAGADKSICKGTSTTIGIPRVAGHFSKWTSNPSGFTDTTSNPTVSPTKTTKYYLLDSISSGCPSKDTVIITVNPLPTPGVGSPKNVCLLSSTTIGATSTTGHTYSWTSNPSGFTSTAAAPSVNPVTNTVYFLTETVTATGCSNSDSITVTVNPLPLPLAGIASTVCAGSPAIIGDTTTTAGHTYHWDSKPSGYTSSKNIDTVKPLLTTIYYITETIAATGCSKMDSVIVSVNPLPIVNAGTSTSICIGSSATLGTSSISGYVYSWSSRPAGYSSTISNPSVSPLVNTTYYLSDTISATGCNKSDSIIITVNPLPTVNVGTTSTICSGSSAAIGAASTSGETYSWASNPSGFTSTSSNPSVSPTLTTIYKLTTTITATSCSNSDSIVISVNPLPSANAGTSASICKGTSAIIGAVAVSGNTYNWISKPLGFTDTTSNPKVSPTVTTTYYLTEKIIASSCSKSDSVTITINPSPTPSFTFSSLVCAGITNVFGTTYNLGSAYKWIVKGGKINSGGGTDSINVSWNKNASGSVMVTETSASGCSDSVAHSIIIDTACVWPGDANYDRIVDVKDILSIGVGMFKKGKNRPNASSIWVGQPCLNWADTFANGVNYKYADCNGDSTISPNDANSVKTNYSKIHTKSLTFTQGAVTDPHLNIVFSKDSIQAGDTVMASINLGTSSLPAAGVYGLAFSLVYPSALIDTVFADFSSSWIATKPLSFSIIPAAGQLDMAVVRTNQKDTTGYGTIAKVYFKVKGALPNKREQVHVTFSNNTQINIAQNYKPVFMVNDSVIVDRAFTGIATTVKQDANCLIIYPNPFSNQTTLNYTLVSAGHVRVTVYTADGREVTTLINQTQDAGIHQVQYTPSESSPQGVYFIRILINNEVITKQLIRVR